MFDNPNQPNNEIQPVVVNAVGSPVQMNIRSAVSTKTNKPYDYLEIMIGEWEIRQFFQSPLERKEFTRVLDQIKSGNSKPF